MGEFEQHTQSVELQNAGWQQLQTILEHCIYSNKPTIYFEFIVKLVFNIKILQTFLPHHLMLMKH